MKKPFKKVIIAVIAAVLVLSIGAGAVVYKTVFGSIGKIDNATLETIAPEMEDFETDEGAYEGDVAIKDIELESVELTDDSDLINILLVGQDRLPGEGRQRSDSMILCSYNSSTNEVSLISFLRDLYVNIPGGYSANRLNAPYVFGGFPLLYDTLAENFGITVDGGIEVDFDGFIELIDLVGGVDINLTAEEVPYVCYDYDLEPGMNHLDGELALNYARIRKIDDDFGRTNRQRTVLLALFNKMKSSDVETLMKLLKKGLSMVTTDMSDTQIISLATKLLPKLSTLKVKTYVVPGDENDYYYASIRGMFVIVPDLPVIKNKLETEYLPLG